MRKLLPIAALPFLLLGCAPETSPQAEGPEMTDDQYRAEAVVGMHDALLADLHTLVEATRALQSAAPLSVDRGWDATLDAPAIAAMRADWVRARTAYEHVEGALAPLFPDLDNSIDARYDDFMTQLEAAGGDHDLFDDQGVTGLHAVERVLYSDVTPQRVVDFERALPGYAPAAFPATAAEAAEFKGKLCAKLVSDAREIEAQWTPANINVAVAFQGLISLITEQREKVQKAASNEEESRYSQRTMADLRDNLAGSKTVYALFRPWLVSRAIPKDPESAGPVIDARVEEGLGKLENAYREVHGDSIPAPPASWSAEAPSASDLRTPFGRLYTVVEDAVDPASAGSVVSELNDAAGALGFPEFQGGR